MVLPAPPVAAIRALVEADLPAVLALNNTHAAEVNALSATALAALVEVATRARIVDGDLGVLRGFLIGFSEATPPQGPNHAWFLVHQPRFLYVDRVVVAPSARGRGLARALYDDLATVAQGRPLCCEVNLDPPNAPSLDFHARLGFTPCGEAADPRNGKRVRYLMRA